MLIKYCAPSLYSKGISPLYSGKIKFPNVCLLQSTNILIRNSRKMLKKGHVKLQKFGKIKIFLINFNVPVFKEGNHRFVNNY